MGGGVGGDAPRGDNWAAVRLTVDGETIVAADGPGLARPLVGLTLLQASMVGGGPPARRAPAAGCRGSRPRGWGVSRSPSRRSRPRSGTYSSPRLDLGGSRSQ